MASKAQRLEDVETALVLAPPLDPAGETACFDHLTAGERPVRNVLNVLLTRRPDRRVDRWEAHVGDRPDRFVVLAAQQSREPPADVAVEPLEHPGDLTSLGVAITERLAEWDPDERTAFCLHSVTAQLQYADRESVYQFHHTLCDHLAERDVVGHVHMNPAAHDRQTVDTFKPLFDGVLEVDEDGTTVRAR